MAANREKLYQNIIHFLKNSDKFLITTHMNADGDAYASVLAIAYLLESWGKSYQIVFEDSEKEDKYQFLWGWEKIKLYKKPWPQKFEAAVILDVPSTERIGGPSDILPLPKKCIKIDHHPSEEHLADLNLVDTLASSTSQLVYEVISRTDIPFNYDIANILFSGIMYDTGRFSFSNTSQRDFEISAHLLQYGVKPHQVARHLFFSNSFNSMKTIGYGLANMESHLEGKVCLIYLPLEIMRQNNHYEIEDLANYSVAIRGVEVGLFIRQPKPGYFKVSFRSRGMIDVNRVAKAFGGGGHKHAAGCRVEASYEDLKQRLIEEISKQFEEIGTQTS